jgi:beta-aspartyl-peptidase (threonine type)
LHAPAAAAASAAAAAASAAAAALLAQWDGRIGDTPIVGAGTWADKQCALSGTGVGEEFIRRAAAHDLASRLAYKGISLRQAMREVVWESFSQGDGGFVGVDADYNIVWDFNRYAAASGAVGGAGDCLCCF